MRHVKTKTSVLFVKKYIFPSKFYFYISTIEIEYFFHFHEKVKTERKQILLKTRSMTHKNEEKCIVNPLLFQYVYIKDIYDNIPVHFYKK